MNMWQIMKSTPNVNAKMTFVAGPLTYNEAVKKAYELNRNETSETVSYHVRVFMPMDRK